MNIVKEAVEFQNRSMSNMSTSERVAASREAKRLVLGINEIYKVRKDPKLMDLMKHITVKKQKIEVRLKGRQTSI